MTVEDQHDKPYEDIDELKERADLLTCIQKAEDEADWSDIDELKERADLSCPYSENGKRGRLV